MNEGNWLNDKCVAIHSCVKDDVGCTTEPVSPNLVQAPCHHQHH